MGLRKAEGALPWPQYPCKVGAHTATPQAHSCNEKIKQDSPMDGSSLGQWYTCTWHPDPPLTQWYHPCCLCLLYQGWGQGRGHCQLCHLMCCLLCHLVHCLLHHLVCCLMCCLLHCLVCCLLCQFVCCPLHYLVGHPLYCLLYHQLSHPQGPCLLPCHLK